MAGILVFVNGGGARAFYEDSIVFVSHAPTGPPGVAGAHAPSHINGTDDIPSATITQKGLMTDEQVVELEGKEDAGVAAAGDAAHLVSFDHDLIETAIQPGDALAELDTTVTGAELNADHAKLGGVEAGATSNSPDTSLLDRSNHTGTQAAATISDFDTEVAANVEVAANSLARHNEASLSGESYLSQVGQQITAHLVNLASHVTGLLPADGVLQTALLRFVTDAEKSVWNGKEDTGVAAGLVSSHESTGTHNQLRINRLSFASVALAEAATYLIDDRTITVADVGADDLVLQYYHHPTSTETIDHVKVLDVANATGRLLLKQNFASELIVENSAEFIAGNNVEDALYEAFDILFDVTDDVAIHHISVTHTVVAGVFMVTITQPEGLNLAFNISKVRLDHTSDVMSKDCTSYAGTDANPKSIYVYVKDTAGVAEIVCSNTAPEGVLEHVDIFIAKVGTVSTESVTIIGDFDVPLEAYESLTRQWHVLLEKGAYRLDGLAFDASQADLTIGSGLLKMIYKRLPSSSQTVSTDGFRHIRSDGSFERKTDFSFTKYSGGEDIGANRYYCVVFGALFGLSTELHAVVQSSPPSEHVSALSAYNDSTHRSVVPTDGMVQKFFVPICYVVVQNTTDDYLQEINGEYGFQVSAGSGGGAASVSNVENGTVDDDFAVWDNTTGRYNPQTPEQVKAILGLPGYFPFWETYFSPEFDSVDSNRWNTYQPSGSLTYGSGVLTYNSGTGSHVANLNNIGVRMADYAIKCTLQITDADCQFLVSFRYDDGNNGDLYGIKIVPGTPGEAYLYRYDAWTPTTLDSDTSLTIALSTDYDIKIIADGSNLSILIDGVEILSAIDSNYREGTVEFEFNSDVDDTDSAILKYAAILIKGQSL
jgi:hypothetical protein